MMNKLKRGNSSPISPKEPNKQEWTGQIIGKKRLKVYKKNEFYGNIYFRLKAIEEKDEKARVLFVYPNLVSKEIFNTIEQNQHLDKKYLFYCERIKWGWILEDWQELTNHE